LVIACGLAANADEAKTTPAIADPNPARFEADIRAFEAWDSQNAVPDDAVLFVGSSSIRMWPTAESFPGLMVVNRGFGGSHISDVNHFAERIVLRYSPRLIVLYAGDNDVADGKSPRQVVEDFRAFVELVHRRLPETRILYLPIKPSLARWDNWPQMGVANSAVEKMAINDDRLDYVDTATVLLSRDGRPRPELFLDDGLHLNAEGYRIWNDTLRPAIARAADER
jgi:lysophospholipase L1-like esterase